MAENPTWPAKRRFADALQYTVWNHGTHADKVNGDTYIGHLLAVAALVIEHGGTEDQAIAGLLHDLIEDTPTSFEELEREMGAAVREMVLACTDAKWSDKKQQKEHEKDWPERDKEIAWAKRKQAYIERLSKKSADDPALIVVLADKVHNAERTARDVLRNPKFLHEGRFNAPFELQCSWYVALADTLASRGIPVTDRRHGLVERLQQAVATMFTDQEREVHRCTLKTTSELPLSKDSK